MVRVIVVAVLATVGTVAGVQGQERDWSGLWLGGSAGFAVSDWSTPTQGEDFCFTGGTAGQTTECIVGGGNTFAGVVVEDDYGAAQASGQSGVQGGLAGTSAGAGSGAGEGFPPGVVTFNQPGPLNYYTAEEAGSGARATSVFQREDGTNVQVIGATASYATGETGTAVAGAAATYSINGDVMEQAFAIALSNVFASNNNPGDPTLTLGADLHYNYQLDSGLVVGVGAALDFGTGGTEWSEDFDLSGDGHLRATQSVRQDALLRAQGRIGYAMGDVMPYVTGGLALGLFSDETKVEFTPPSFGDAEPSISTIVDSQSGTAPLLGGVVGAGVSYMLSDDIALGAEFNYTMFDGSVSFGNGASVDIGNQLSLATTLNVKM